ncbi:DEAD/DEAH box helicase family protein [Hymenobacter sp. BRD67]|uniref:restriction endonuclease n=1 Tax=Hymenobacter sp. BRD67 TaxID=2675877 RepID=UPI0015674CA7|nr:DEAD/DEAH box helicase family protein [Hymenobacter sp. BRD67]QKG51283.1 DEAD/DEAH box helicase family protein [Hymenobacter sp. BRD67]
MKLQFDASQEYQQDAIQAVVAAFEGQPLSKAPLEVSVSTELGDGSLAFTETGIANRLVLAAGQLLENIRCGQATQKLPLSDALVPCAFRNAAGQLDADSLPLNLTVEMETGTGKTYVYLRTIYELNRTYGFRKFVIVVPSVAIREGVWKSLQITHDHLQALFGYPPVSYEVYDSGRLAALRNFAVSDALQILVINIDSFTKDTNIINKPRETGVRPIEYLQATRPIVVVDEPQNLDSDLRKAALASLRPLATLRYSATHKEFYNLVYSLNPVQAYDLGLVKQIEVDGITADGNYNAAFVRLKHVEKAKNTLTAKLSIYSNEKGGVRLKDVTVRLGNDLYALSNNRETYREGFIVNEIDPTEQSVTFSGNLRVVAGQDVGGLTEAVLRYQLERTVKWHFEKVRRLKPKGIKVLSLVFVDRVANYRLYDVATKTKLPGKFAQWFEEIFTTYAAKKENAGLIPFTAKEVHDGYFSQDKSSPAGKDTRGDSTLDRDTYALIMRDKERLLSQDEPLQFIFSHSALREGWDNPNVFQICTLNETQSDVKKRQEIGRGLRLPVDATGQRVQDKSLNMLTVVANESYEDFSAALQREIQEETGVEFTGRTRNAAKRRTLRLSKELTSNNYPEFFAIWERIKHRTRYRVEYQTEALIAGAVAELLDHHKTPPTHPPQLQARKARLSYTDEGITGQLAAETQLTLNTVTYPVPDVYGYLQSRVDVTRPTIFQILKRSGRYGELLINPQMFLDNVVGAIRRTLNRLQVAGIRYERLAGEEYAMQLFKDEEVEQYLTNLYEVENPARTLYNYVPVDSSTEKSFAESCDKAEQVAFYFKLPRGFLIPTPLGKYRPDWAIVLKGDKRVYFVVETKGSAGQATPIDQQALRGREEMKIDCGTEHFALFAPQGVAYEIAANLRDVYE